MAGRHPPDWNQISNSYSRAIVEGDLLVELLRELGCEIRGSWSGDAIRLACPIHDGNGANLEIRYGDTLPIVWRCYSGKCHLEYKPSLLGFVRGVLTSKLNGKKAKMREAIDYLEGFLGRSPARVATARRPSSSPERSMPLRLGLEEFRDRVAVPSCYFLDRGFSAEILEEFSIGDSTRKERAMVPLMDDLGEYVVGELGRSFHAECPDCEGYHAEGKPCGRPGRRWQVTSGFSLKRYVFNYHGARASDGEFAFLVEGVPDVLRLAEAGVPAVALLGSSATDQQMDKIARLDKPVVAAFDNDRAGELAWESLQASAPDFDLEVARFPVPEAFKDVGEMPSAILRRAVHRFLREQAVFAAP
jgi:hypothetical protein